MSILDLPYSDNFDLLYLTSRKYAFEPYRFTYKCRPNNYIRHEDDYWTITTKPVDCIAFVLMILREIARRGVWEFPMTRVNNYNELIIEAINQGILHIIQDSRTMTTGDCGTFVYLKDSMGLIEKGERHMGFYFCFGDNITIIHNSYYYGELGGVVEQKMTHHEFDKFIDSYYQFYVS
jgi:hypothetical protein